MKKLILFITILLLNMGAQAYAVPAQPEPVDTVTWTHDGRDIAGNLIDMSTVGFRKYCGTVSGIYTVPPVDLGAGELLADSQIDGSYSAPVDINGPDGVYWCALTAYDMNNPIESESAYSSEYVIFKRGGIYLKSAAYKSPFGILLIKKLP